MFGVVANIPNKSLARVPELPKFNLVFDFALKDPKPFPNILYSLFFPFKIFTPNFFKQFIVDITSSDVKEFLTTETP